MKFLLDLAPAVLFFVAYVFGGIYAATATLIASLVAVLVVYWLWKREIPKAHLFTTVVAGVLGGLTLWVRDPSFIKYKPSVVYAAFALALLGSQVTGSRQPLLQRIPQKTFQFPDPVWRRVNFAWGLFFIGCAALNLYVANHYDEATWVKLKAFGFSVLTLIFLLAHLPFLYRYLPQE